MFKALILGFIGYSSASIVQSGTPHSSIGSKSIACNTSSAPQKTNGFAMSMIVIDGIIRQKVHKAALLL